MTGRARPRRSRHPSPTLTRWVRLLAPALWCCGGALVILAGAVAWGARGAGGAIAVALTILGVGLVRRRGMGRCCKPPEDRKPRAAWPQRDGGTMTRGFHKGSSRLPCSGSHDHFARARRRLPVGAAVVTLAAGLAACGAQAGSAGRVELYATGVP